MKKHTYCIAISRIIILLFITLPLNIIKCNNNISYNGAVININNKPIYINDETYYYEVINDKFNLRQPEIAVNSDTNIIVSNIDFIRENPMTVLIHLEKEDSIKTIQVTINNPELKKILFHEDFEEFKNISKSFSTYEKWSGNSSIKCTGDVYKYNRGIILSEGSKIEFSLNKNKYNENKSDIKINLLSLNSKNSLNVLSSSSLFHCIGNAGSKTDTSFTDINTTIKHGTINNGKITLECTKGKYIINSIEVNHKPDTISEYTYMSEKIHNEFVTMLPGGYIDTDNNEHSEINSLDYFITDNNHPIINNIGTFDINEYIRINHITSNKSNIYSFPFDISRLLINNIYAIDGININLFELTEENINFDNTTVIKLTQKQANTNNSIISLKQNIPYIIEIPEKYKNKTEDTITFIADFDNLRIPAADSRSDISGIRANPFLRNLDINNNTPGIIVPENSNFTRTEDGLKLHPFGYYISASNDFLEQTNEKIINVKIYQGETECSSKSYFNNVENNGELRFYYIEDNKTRIYNILNNKGYSITNLNNSDNTHKLSYQIDNYKLEDIDIEIELTNKYYNIESVNLINQNKTQLEEVAKYEAYVIKPTATRESYILEVTLQKTSNNLLNENPSSIDIKATEGTIEITTEKETEISLFNISGTCLNVYKLNPGKNYINVSKGIYIVLYNEHIKKRHDVKTTERTRKLLVL